MPIASVKEKKFKINVTKIWYIQKESSQPAKEKEKRIFKFHLKQILLSNTGKASN